MKTPIKFRVGQLVQTTAYVQGHNRTICTGERGTIREAKPARHGENRYAVAFAVSNDATDGTFTYWCDESVLEQLPAMVY